MRTYNGRLTRLLAMLLSLTMAWGMLPMAALAEDGEAYYDAAFEAAYRQLVQDLYGEDMAGIFGIDDIGLEILFFLLKAGASAAAAKGSNMILDSIFPENARHAEILSHLVAIEGQLNTITEQLNKLIILLKEESLQRKLEHKIEVMEKAMPPLKRAFEAYEKKDATGDDKTRALNIFFNYKPEGYANAFYFFEYYCTMVAGTGTYRQTSTFDLYDQIADLKWNFDLEAAGFRQTQRDADIHFITRMASVLILWLQNEMRDGYKSAHLDDLPMYQKMLTDGLQSVYDKYSSARVILDENVRTFHYYGANYKASFDIYMGYSAGQSNSTVNLTPVFEKELRKHGQTSAVRKSTLELIEKAAVDVGLPGEIYHLITGSELKELQHVANTRGISVLQLLVEGAGYDDSGSTRVLFQHEGDTLGQPLFFNPVSAFNPRRMYIQNVDIAAKGDALWSNTLFGILGTMTTDKDEFEVVWPRSYYRYNVVRESDNHVDEMQKDFTLLWTGNTQNLPPSLPAYDPELAPFEGGEGESPARIDAIEGGVMTVTIRIPDVDTQPEDPEVGKLFIDGDTQITDAEGNEIADPQSLIGQEVMLTIYYPPDDPSDHTGDDEARMPGEPRYTVTRIALAGDTVGERQSIEGMVLRIEDAARIIGGDEDIVISTGGGERAFDLPDDVPMDERIREGATVRITYHEGEGLPVVESIQWLGDDSPAPTPEEITGVVSHVHAADDIPGGEGHLSLSMPGGDFSIAIPFGFDLPQGVREGATVRAMYHAEGGTNMLDSIEVVGASPDDPVPAPQAQWAEGTVTAYDDAQDVPGGERVITLMADREFIIVLPADMTFDFDLRVGDTLHIDFHEDAPGRLLADYILLLMPGPLPTPSDDPMPGPIDNPTQEEMPGPVTND